METTNSWVDASSYTGRGIDDFLDRKPADIWYVAASPIIGGKVVWELSESGTKFRIPTIPYVMCGEPHKAMAFAAQLGQLAVYEYFRARNPPDILRLHIVIGQPVIEVAMPIQTEHDAEWEVPPIRLLVGFAFQVRPKV